MVNKKEHRETVPKGYWKNIDNVLSCLNPLIEKYKRFPSTKEIKEEYGRSLITAMTSYHGGALKVKQLLGYESKRWREGGHWKDIDNVKKELLNLKEKIGHFPTSWDLYKYNLNGLRTAIYRYHGGLDKIRFNMGEQRPFKLKAVKVKKPEVRLYKTQLAEGKAIDLYNPKGKYDNWKVRVNKEGVKGVCKENSEWIIRFVNDVELGLNQTYRRKRGYQRLSEITGSLPFIARLIEKHYHKSLIALTIEDVHRFFNDLENGVIKKEDGTNYNSLNNILKNLKAFWNWYVRIKKKEHAEIENACSEMSKYKKENTFVYITLEQLIEVLPEFTRDCQALLAFVFDTGCRCPKELSNILGKDIIINNDEVWVNLRISKTFARKFNLTVSKDIILTYMDRNNIEPNEPLFKFYVKSYSVRRKLNLQMREVFQAYYGYENTEGGKPYSALKLYDFRHSSACYYRSLSIPVDKLLYRFGWSSLEMANYYSKFVGHNGRITQDDLTNNNPLMQVIEKQAKQIEQLTQALILLKEHKLPQMGSLN